MQECIEKSKKVGEKNCFLGVDRVFAGECEGYRGEYLPLFRLKLAFFMVEKCSEKGVRGVRYGLWGANQPV